MVDHIDTYGPKADWGDRWKNLRLATPTENSRNRRIGINNRSGRPGVCWVTSARKWRAFIVVARRQVLLGDFADKEMAIAARIAAEVRLFGEFRPTEIAA